ncbi:DEAD/DEAH box helicase [Desulfovibrio psychrotolerans]|uniref:DEAD-box ATP-dependent RNA helicase RhpA n=1 Tax=Desulfovibrio psychrotolerans TaxID=415242 RepID=A0A7J0BY10_9BACT|nr:DEAD/DEAH box helicase [Desulfovibrio psychrotolerans]GFM38072.1 RNA helicase [Desulfovibrio psychrotolerans]
MEGFSFEGVELSPEVLKSIEDMGFEEASPIQALAIPPIMQGRDIIGQAQTGTGKTAAFGIPILERINPRERDVQAIVLCPTRELAIQVSEEISNLAKRMRSVNVLPVYGGQPIDRQFKALKRGVQVVVGTPGRVMDHLERGTIVLDKVVLAVLDEADEMLDMGFREDIEFILEKVPDSVQTVFFSATMPQEILNLAKRFLKDPEFLKVTQKVLTVPNIEQIYYEVRPFQKIDALCRVMDVYNPKLTVVFCSTKRGVDELTANLQGRGYQADGLHGNLNQTQRDRVMNRFRKGGIEILVATDVAARGIDVENVEAVVNFDIPNDVEYYVHRIGRTGRAGRSGRAFTFVSPKEFWKLRDIKRYTKARIVQHQIPSIEEVETAKSGKLLQEIRQQIQTGNLERYISTVESFIETEFNGDLTTMEMAAALLRIMMKRDLGDALPDETSGGFGDTGAQVGMVRLFLNVGRKMRIGARDIVGAIAGETGLPGKMIGNIEIYDRFCFVEVPQDYAPEVLTVMNGNQIRGFRLFVEPASRK